MLIVKETTVATDIGSMTPPERQTWWLGLDCDQQIAQEWAVTPMPRIVWQVDSYRVVEKWASYFDEREYTGWETTSELYAEHFLGCDKMGAERWQGLAPLDGQTKLTPAEEMLHRLMHSIRELSDGRKTEGNGRS